MRLTHILAAAAVSMATVSSSAPVQTSDASPMTRFQRLPNNNFKYGPPRRKEIKNNPVHDAQDEADPWLYPLRSTPRLGAPTPAGHANKADNWRHEHKLNDHGVHKSDDPRDHMYDWDHPRTAERDVEGQDMQQAITKSQHPRVAARSPWDAWPEMIGEKKDNYISEAWSWKTFEENLGPLASG